MLRQPINNNFTRALDVSDQSGERPADLRGVAEHEPGDAYPPPRAAVPINPFGLNQWDPAARDYVLGTLHEWYKMNEYVVAGNVQGDLFELPGGAMGFAAGVESSARQRRRDARRVLAVVVLLAELRRRLRGELKVIEGYAETAMPFLSDKRGVELLELDVAVRRTNYENYQPAHYEYYNNGTIIYVEDRESTIGATTYKIERCSTIRPSGSASARRVRATFVRRTSRSSTSGPRASGSRAASNPWTGATDLPLVANTGNIDVGGRRGRHGNVRLRVLAAVVVGPRVQAVGRLVEDRDRRRDRAARRGGASIDGCFRGNAMLCTFIDGDGPGGVMTNIRNPYLNLDVYSTKGVDLEALYQFDLSGGAANGPPPVRDAHRRGRDDHRGPAHGLTPA